MRKFPPWSRGETAPTSLRECLSSSSTGPGIRDALREGAGARSRPVPPLSSPARCSGTRSCAIGLLDEEAGHLFRKQREAIDLLGGPRPVPGLRRGTPEDALDPGDERVQVEVAADRHRGPAADRPEVDPAVEDRAKDGREPFGGAGD